MPVQVRFGENNMPRHDKTSGKSDGKGKRPGAQFGRNGYTVINRYRMPMQYMVECYRLEENVQYRIGPSAGQVPECLCRYQVNERPVKKINDSYYDMSRSAQQIVKIRCKGNAKKSNLLHGGIATPTNTTIIINEFHFH